ncbi:hypothetical protein BDN70DRAFT_898624 [Pholiota conissans]|uniref:Uncharacterized protein n=1 Tax=Pholiota conissans TaxID=109636 RepID=A0A9P6CVL9_9AGAR|nr:hypothetical protein BDN70DRAFT_898624 [Pholiota conissans]
MSSGLATASTTTMQPPLTEKRQRRLSTRSSKVSQFCEMERQEVDDANTMYRCPRSWGVVRCSDLISRLPVIQSTVRTKSYLYTDSYTFPVDANTIYRRPGTEAWRVLMYDVSTSTRRILMLFFDVPRTRVRGGSLPTLIGAHTHIPCANAMYRLPATLYMERPHTRLA